MGDKASENELLSASSEVGGKGENGNRDEVNSSAQLLFEDQQTSDQNIAARAINAKQACPDKAEKEKKSTEAVAVNTKSPEAIIVPPLSSEMPFTKKAAAAVSSVCSYNNNKSNAPVDARPSLPPGSTSPGGREAVQDMSVVAPTGEAAGNKSETKENVDVETVISDLSTWRIYGADVDDAELKEAVKNHLERKNQLRVAENLKARASIADPSSPNPSRLARRNSMGRLIESSSPTPHCDRGLKRRASLWQPVRDKFKLKGTRTSSANADNGNVSPPSPAPLSFLPPDHSFNAKINPSDD